MPQKLFQITNIKSFILTKFSICLNRPLRISQNRTASMKKDGGIVTKVTSTFRGKTITTEASGNGRLDAVSNALKKAYELKYSLETYQEHALERSSSSKAIAYVGIKKPDGTLAWGAGVDADIIRASIDALVTAINNR